MDYLQQRDSMMLSSLSGNMYSHQNIFQCALPSIPDDEEDDEEEEDDNDVGSEGVGGGGNSSRFQANITNNSTIDNNDYNMNNGRLFDERLLGLKMSGFQFSNNNFIPTSHGLPNNSSSGGTSNVHVNNSIIKDIGTSQSMDIVGQNNSNSSSSSSKGIHGTDSIQHLTNNILMLGNPTTTSDHHNNTHHANENGYSNSISASDLHEYEMSLLYPLSNRNNSSEAQNVLDSTGYYYSNYLSKFNELNEVVNNEVNDHRNGLLDMNDTTPIGNNRIITISSDNHHDSSSSSNVVVVDSNHRHSSSMSGGSAMMMRNNLELLSDSSSCLSLQQLPVHALLQQHHQQQLLQQQQQQQQRLSEEDSMMRDSSNLTSLHHPVKQMVILSREGGGGGSNSSSNSKSNSDVGDEGGVSNILQYSQSSSYGVATTSISGMSQGQGHGMFGNNETIQV